MMVRRGWNLGFAFCFSRMSLAMDSRIFLATAVPSILLATMAEVAKDLFWEIES